MVEIYFSKRTFGSKHSRLYIKRIVCLVLLQVCLIIGYHIVLNSIPETNGLKEQHKDITVVVSNGVRQWRQNKQIHVPVANGPKLSSSLVSNGLKKRVNRKPLPKAFLPQFNPKTISTELRKRLDDLHVSNLEDLYYFDRAKYADTIAQFCSELQVDPELTVTCDETFYPTVEQNLEKIKSYPTQHAEMYLQQHENSIFPKKSEIDKRIDVPVFVTGASSNHFQEVQNNIKSVREVILPANPGAKYIVYDLGLAKSEKEHIANVCECEVRRFPFTDYPAHVRDLHTFAWKPLIIQTLLTEYGAVFWMDASIVFHHGNISAVLSNARQFGISIWDTGLAYSPVTLTDPRTFSYLNEPRCLHRDLGMIEANAMLVVLSNFSWTAIMKPWLACALAHECIAPPGSSTTCEYLTRIKLKTFTCCHRQDQSALSIILNRLYQYSLHRDVYIPEKILDVVKTD